MYVKYVQHHKQTDNDTHIIDFCNKYTKVFLVFVRVYYGKTVFWDRERNEWWWYKTAHTITTQKLFCRHHNQKFNIINQRLWTKTPCLVRRARRVLCIRLNTRYELIWSPLSARFLHSHVRIIACTTSSLFLSEYFSLWGEWGARILWGIWWVKTVV